MSFETNCHIEIPGDKLRDAIRLAYEYSGPLGLGVLHYREGTLSDADINEIIENERPGGRIAASMDYVHGRACKFTIFREEGRLYVRPRWGDHTLHQLERLLTEIGVEDADAKLAIAQENQRLENEKWERLNRQTARSP